MVCQLALISLAIAILGIATFANGENLKNEVPTSYSSTLRPGAEINLLPENWPSAAEMRNGYGSSSFFEFTRRDARANEKVFQHLIAQEFPGYGLTPKDIQYLWLDLNSDGVKEVILRIRRSEFCGSIGCESIILERVNNTWGKIGRGQNFNGITTGAPIRNGYKTLWFGDMCLVGVGEGYRMASDDRQDGKHIHPHACGKNYDRDNADAAYACPDCHV